MRERASKGTERSPLPVGNPDRTAILYRLTDRLYRAPTMSEVYDAALDAITEAMDCRRASVLLFDDTAVMRFVAWRGLSDRYRSALEGHTPWKPGDHNPQPLFIADIERSSEPDAVKETVIAEGIRSLAFVPLMSEGAVIGKFMTYYEDARQFTDEECDLALTIARQIGFSLERTRSEQARLAAEQDMQASEERFRAMSELAPAMMWLSDHNGACLHLNRKLREFWDVSEDAVATFDWRTSMHPDDAATIGASMLEAITTRSETRVKGRYLNFAGQYRTLQTEATPRFSTSGEFLGLVGVNADVTERESVEAQRDLLTAELKHRVKNILAVVQGIAHQTLKTADSLEEARKTFDGRIGALARAYDALATGDQEVASLKALAEGLMTAHGMGRSRARVSGQDVMLPSRYALSFTLATHELFTNALKYGAFSNDYGSVDLACSVNAGNLNIVWTETGGPRIEAPKTRGFGSILIQRTLSDVGGKAEKEYRPEGLVCRMSLPLPSETG
jgi:PAS domain S-box-containing protein